VSLVRASPATTVNRRIASSGPSAPMQNKWMQLTRSRMARRGAALAVIRGS